MWELLKKIFIGKPPCNHDYDVSVGYYTDTSFNCNVPSMRYQGVCFRCGDSKWAYLYGTILTKDQVRVILNNGRKPKAAL